MNITQPVQRNYSIDSLKFVCAILVVFIHCSYPYKEYLLPITDVAVPLFFCISGYFVSGVKRKWNRISRIAKILLGSSILYLVKTELFWLFTKQKFYVPTLKNIFDFIFFNDISFSIHLWYLSAYIYVLIIAFFIDRYAVWKYSVYIIFPLLLVGVCIKYQIRDICPNDIQFYRNAYFNGLPFFLLGAVVKKSPPRLFYNILVIRNIRIISTLLIIFLFIVRYMLNEENFMNLILREVNLILLAYIIVFMVVKSCQSNDNILSKLGRDYSLYIYIFHVLVIQVIDFLVAYLQVPMYNVFMLLNPFVVVLFSIVLTLVLGKLKLINV